MKVLLWCKASKYPWLCHTCIRLYSITRPTNETRISSLLACREFHHI